MFQVINIQFQVHGAAYTTEPDIPSWPPIKVNSFPYSFRNKQILGLRLYSFCFRVPTPYVAMETNITLRLRPLKSIVSSHPHL